MTVHCTTTDPQLAVASKGTSQDDFLRTKSAALLTRLSSSPEPLGKSLLAGGDSSLWHPAPQFVVVSAVSSPQSILSLSLSVLSPSLEDARHSPNRLARCSLAPALSSHVQLQGVPILADD